MNVINTVIASIPQITLKATPTTLPIALVVQFLARVSLFTNDLPDDQYLDMLKLLTDPFSLRIVEDALSYVFFALSITIAALLVLNLAVLSLGLHFGAYEIDKAKGIFKISQLFIYSLMMHLDYWIYQP